MVDRNNRAPLLSGIFNTDLTRNCNQSDCEGGQTTNELEFDEKF